MTISERLSDRADTSSELYRHQCEVRWCISKGREFFDVYVRDVAAARGRAAAKALIRDVKAQASLGNTGEWSDWRENSQISLA
ncbi:MAG TPA: hypothetical protein VLD59_08200 [Steroidobacteraceae bacterium]|nr:hypothetical protein [Steroidobacteraceae bacterium]